jgi:phosphoglycolate phosphatase-like HAD superfamily hydrolase
LSLRILYLYDIDGTVLGTGGAGRRALDQAFQKLHGIPAAFAGLSFAGVTDQRTVSRALARLGLPSDPQAMGEIQAAYLAELPGVLSEMRSKLVLHPGVREALSATANRGTNALLTGNWREGARIKLNQVGLWHSFVVGAFGDDSGDRNDLVPVAERRAREAGVRFERTVVIGDTPSDVACARAGGAVSVAVLTGWGSRTELEAAKPDLLIEDLATGLRALLKAA